MRELDKYIIGQHEAKKSVAIALRNRWRRLQVPENLREEIMPNNIILIGPTGVGKNRDRPQSRETFERPLYQSGGFEIHRGRLRRTRRRFHDPRSHRACRGHGEVGTDGEVQEKAEHLAEERILDILIPSVRKTKADANATPETPTDEELNEKTRERFREKIKAGQLDDRIIELDVPSDQFPAMQILGPMNLEEIGVNLQDVFGNLMPKKMKKRKLSIAEAKKILVQEEAQKLIDQDAAVKEAIHRVENSGIVFLDEVDKIAGNRGASGGPDVSREGVQRDLLPIVEGSTVATKYGMVRTDHVLFIASGAFHVSKPSDLIPELQGRFPIRVELKSLTEDDFVKILTLPQNALIKQYTALLKTDGIEIEFADEAIRAIARIATQVNEEVENIGARRLHTIMTSLLEEILFEAPEKISAAKLSITKNMVEEKLNTIVKDKDLSRFIL